MAIENGLRLQSSALVLTGDPLAGAVTLARNDGAVVFSPLVARARFRDAESNREYDPVSSVVKGWQWERAEVDTPLGPAPGFRAMLSDAAGLPAVLVWEGALSAEEDALFRLRLENRSARPLSVHELVPAAYRGADPGLDMGAGYTGWRFFRTGYQSWSPAGSVGVMEPEPVARFFLPRICGMGPRTPYSSRPGEKAADWMAQLVEPRLGLSALMGFITSADFLARVEMEVKYDRFRRLEAVADGEEILLGPGESINSEWVMVSLSRDPQALQARYFENWARAMHARAATPKTGWCSWYFAFNGVAQATVERNLAALREFPVEVHQVDAGFEAEIGDWTNWNAKFVWAPARLAAHIREQGRSPGLWLAPFLVSRRSSLYQDHPEWVLRDRRGLPVVAFLHPEWKWNVIYALDATRPEVEDWLRKTIATVVREHGFEYLKLDFLYAAALPGVRRDRKATGAMALRRGLRAIREAAGEETYLLGCGCPLGPAVGLVDAMRVSPDIDIRWEKKFMDAVLGVPVGPGGRNCLRNNLARLAMHGRLWANDPDCAVLRSARGGMTESELKAQLTVYYLSGGAAFLSEDAPRLPPERLDWFKRLLPPSNRAAAAVDLFEKDFPELVFLPGEDSALVALFNWSDRPAARSLDLKRLGLSGAWHVFDGWSETYLGAAHTRMELGPAPAHGVIYLRLVRADGRARVLGTNLHLGLGEVGVKAEPQGRGLRVSVALPGERSGKLWAVFAGGKVAVKEIVFTDRWEGELAPW